eukprot:CAMPEP_0194198580 /NCGR_PEP_ID=MMETSP0154-20130528/77843_1 /TAXON_ID=1049557 /ORGANISM="Thalassiothrix antarctica, Strain L6-D1" /LENGTH=308 /DNA_ID=CAMNT_0038923385 /DNA_START=348 /DNA_END=1270 /DNA_ORIENTATION=-
MAITWEVIGGILFRIVLDLLVALFTGGVALFTGGVGTVSDSYFNSVIMNTIGFAKTAAADASSSDYLSIYAHSHHFIYAMILAVHAFVLAAFIEELTKYLSYPMIMENHPDFWTRSELEAAAASLIEKMYYNQEEEDDDENEVKSRYSIQNSNTTTTEKTRKKQELNQILTDLDLSLQEEKSSPATRGSMITITIISIALGFTCCENLIYVFLYNENTIQTEFTVLVLRMLLPIHVLCAAYQAIGIIRRDVEGDVDFTTAIILIPSVVLHGTFDWILLYVGEFCNRQLVACCIVFVFVLLALAFYYLV